MLALNIVFVCNTVLKCLLKKDMWYCPMKKKKRENWKHSRKKEVLTNTNRFKLERPLGNNFPTIVDITGITKPKRKNNFENE